jgi:hypothetical protein
MKTNWRAAGAALVIAVGLGLVVQLASFFLKLGLFWPAPWVAGGMLLGWSLRGLLTGDRRVGGIATALVALLVYGATLRVTESRWFGQRSSQTVRMTWEDRGTGNDVSEPEIVLRYVGSPRNYVGIYSRDLARQLATNGRDTVSVVLRITRDLGCLRGLRIQEIEGTTGWRAASGYNGSSGPGRVEPPVDPGPAWCP